MVLNTNANWISNSDETKSTNDYVFTLGGDAVAWRSTRQTMESKFVALEMDDSEAKWLKNFIANIPLGMEPTPSIYMHCDS